MNVRPISLILLLTLGVIASASAQDGKTYSYSTSTGAGKQSAQEVEDIGEIEESKEAFQSFRDKLRFNVQARAAYTTNAKLDGSHGSSDALFMPTVEAGFHTPLGKHFSFDLSTKLESVLYAKYDERSFVGYSAMATLDYRIKKGLPRFYASIEPYRYDSFDTGDLMTQAIGFTGGTDWGFAFNGGRTLGFVGYSFTDYLSDPNIDSRLVHRAVVGLAHQIRSNITGQVYYVYQYSDFTDFNREDSKHTAAANLIYQFSDRWFGSLTASFVNNGSDQNNASYESFSTTLGVTFQF